MAIWVARRPSVLPSASTSSQRRTTSLSRAEYVFIQVLRRWPKRPRANVLRGARPAVVRPGGAAASQSKRWKLPSGFEPCQTPANASRELLEQASQPRQRQAHNVRVVALEPLHELSREPLDPRSEERRVGKG